MTKPPFFSIAIATYKRPEILAEALHSILSQSFHDFEIVIGNNDPTSKIILSDLNINDSRIRVINREENIGQIPNMNALIHELKGEYHTWLADDDLFLPGFLETSYNEIQNNPDVEAFFSSYVSFNTKAPKNNFKNHSLSQVHSGASLLEGIFSGKIHIISCYGWYKNSLLQKFNGMEYLTQGTSAALYSEYVLMARISELTKVIYVPLPYIGYRIHPQSWGVGNSFSDLYQEAGIALMRRIHKILLEFCEPSLSTQGGLFFLKFLFDNWLVKESLAKDSISLKKARHVFLEFYYAWFSTPPSFSLNVWFFYKVLRFKSKLILPKKIVSILIFLRGILFLKRKVS